MVEQIVDFILGFVICGLIGLAFLPLVSRRARRLTLARIEARLPMTFDEIEAERDLLRARFAVELRALEIKAEQARLAHAEDEAELGRRALATRQANEQWAQTAAMLEETQAKLDQSLEFGEKTLAELSGAREYQSELDIHAAALGAALEKAEARLAAFDVRRKRLLRRLVTERQRGHEFEKANHDLRRALAEAEDSPPVFAVGSDGVAFSVTPEREMRDLREAIARIGQQVAHFDTARD